LVVSPQNSINYYIEEHSIGGKHITQYNLVAKGALLGDKGVKLGDKVD